MSNVFRKASLSLKKNRDRSERSESPASTHGDRPPKAHGNNRPGKGRKRLSSLFSSSSNLAALEREESPAKRNISAPTLVSTSSSGQSTPARPSVLGNGRASSGNNTPSNGLRKLSLNGNGATVLSTSPETSTPTSPSKGVSGSRFVEGAIDSNGSNNGTFPNSNDSSPTPTKRRGQTANSEQRRQRTSSLYSQWDLSEAAEASSDEEDEAYLTPSEGLSEVEEEDEEEDKPAVAAAGGAGAAIAGAGAGAAGSTKPAEAIDTNNVEKGARADTEDVLGTGPSTIRRSVPKVDETRVHKRQSTKTQLDVAEQAASLAADIDVCRECLTLFLTSHMKEAEDLCLEKDPEGTRLYLLSALGVINALKGMMTFDSIDLANALEICKATSAVSTSLRKPSDSIVSRLGGLVRTGAGVGRVKAMTDLERHAELVYAESTLMKAMIAIIAGGDWLGLVREALNMRTAHGVYRTLQMFLDDADKDGYDDDIDMDFRSGVSLGTGTSSLMLSLLPGKVLKIAEVFGYAGDRRVALDTLMAAGGWSTDSNVPAVNEKNEGVRRPICDMILLAFHLVISVLMPVDGIDIPLARKILEYNTKRYPDGVFFLYFQARLHTTQCEPELSIQSLQKALDLELEYIQLQHMCLWDYALNYFQLVNWKGALDCFAILKEESNWSRAVYTYSAAACLVQLADEGKASMAEADKLMKLIPKLTKKIAGKSLPIEKLASRKARKFESQGHRLFLPAEELAYVYGALGHCPRDKLLELHYPLITHKLQTLEESTPETYGNGHEYWDDYALGHFLRGYVQFTARYQPPDAVESAKKAVPGQLSDEELDKAAEDDFLAVVKHAPNVQLDHYILYHCHYELGRLYARRGETEQAKKQFDVVMSGKLPEINHHERKSQGKYSLEGALLLKTHAALQSLAKGEAV